MKVLNELPILVEVAGTNENAIRLKFVSTQYFDTDKYIFILNISGNNISQNIGSVKDRHLNTPTVVVDEVAEVEFYSGYLDESPDWGDWTSGISIAFTSYSGEFTLKTQEDWNNELVYVLGDRVRTAAFQSTIDSGFRESTAKQMLDLIKKARISEEVKERLASLLSKLNELDDCTFYNMFITDYKLGEQ